MSDTNVIGGPVHVPEARLDLRRHVKVVLDRFVEDIVEALVPVTSLRTPGSLLQAEETLRRVLGVVCTHLVGGLVAWMHKDLSWTAERIAATRGADPRKLRHRGFKWTAIEFLGGACLRFLTPYFSVDRNGLPGKRRAVGRRGRAGGGCFPVLEALGIHHGTSPALASEVARESVRCASFAEASTALAERGIHLDAKAVSTIAMSVGNEALRQRDRRVAASLEGSSFTNEFAGQRVVLCIDGGRVRTREGGKHGRRGKGGRRRFETPWREPKLFAVYTIDRKGRKIPSRCPLYDGTLGDADEIFRLLTAELKLRGAEQAREIIIIGDGALWIWKRAEDLAQAVGIAPRRITLVADFYHAVEHLQDIADLRAGWSDAQKRRWVVTMRKRLKKGQVDAVIADARNLCTGRAAKKIATHVEYFEERRAFMRYDEFLARGIPRGSGAVESAIRRVVNLRLKGPAIFWRARNVEAMLHLRAYLKAGRWSEIMQRVLHRSANGKPVAVAA
jgi:hypothetical protein